MSHKGSQETYEFIGSWINPNFFFSRHDLWDRMGFLGAFGDFVLSSIPGDIAEVGCGESSIYLSHLARKFNRKIYHCDIAPDKILNPLTVAGYMTKQAFTPPAAGKQAFQVDNSYFFTGPSDEAWQLINGVELALTFIDGDHHYEQAKKDFENALKLTVDNGYIILHDTYPPNEKYLCPDSACGDVYRLRKDIENDPRVDAMTLSRGTAMGVGLTICRKKALASPYYQDGIE